MTTRIDLPLLPKTIRQAICLNAKMRFLLRMDRLSVYDPRLWSELEPKSLQNGLHLHKLILYARSD